MNGWIKLHRQIKTHWIYKNADYFHAWITILLEVNHRKDKVLIGSMLLDIAPGESLKSLDSWAKTFGNGWTKQKVRTFLNLLKADGMVNTQNERKTTRLTVCNYSTYQTEQHDDNTQPNTLITRKQHASNMQATPNKKDKKVKKVKEEVYRAFAHLSLSIPEFERLIGEGYTKEKIDDILDRVENFAANKKYTSLILTARNWLKSDKKKTDGIIDGLNLDSPEWDTA